MKLIFFLFFSNYIYAQGYDVPYHVDSMVIKDNVNYWEISNSIYLKSRLSRDQKIELPADALDQGVEVVSKKSIAYFIRSGLGAVLIEKGEKSLSFNTFKIGGGFTNKLKNDLDLHFSLDLVSFLNIEFSETIGSTNIKTLYPELGISVSKGFDEFTYEVGYSYLQYLNLGKETSTTINFTPKQIHRLSVKFSYQWKEVLSGFAKVGSLNNFEPESLEGVDLSLGVFKGFGVDQKIIAILSLCKSVINTNDDNSEALVVSGSYRI